MHKVYAAGAVLFRKENNTLLFLLVYSARNRIWGFPKGHREEGENEKDAALREIAEETGIRAVRLLEGFREEDVYEAVDGGGPMKGQLVEKHSVYLLGETTGATVTVDNDEISAYRWLPPGEALPLLPFPGLRRIMRRAEEFLARQRNGRR